MAAQISVTIADVIKGARDITGTEKTKQVTNDQLGKWANAGLGLLYDAVIQADESYFSLDADLTFGSGTQAAATQPLPDDFYHMRGVKRWPDTSRAHPIFPVTETDSARKAGYIMRGHNIQITPFWNAGQAGPYRISYAPPPPRWGRLIDISVANEDGIVTGTSVNTNFALKCRNGNFSGSDGNNNGALWLYDCANASVNNLNYPNGYPLIWSGSPAAPITSSELIAFADPSTAMATETFPYGTVAMIVRDGEIVTLDSVLAPYSHYIECYIAARVLEKKKQSTAGMEQLMSAEIARFIAALPDRESEPEAAPVLWRPRYGYGWTNDGGF